MSNFSSSKLLSDAHFRKLIFYDLEFICFWSLNNCNF